MKKYSFLIKNYFNYLWFCLVHHNVWAKPRLFPLQEKLLARVLQTALRRQRRSAERRHSKVGTSRTPSRCSLSTPRRPPWRPRAASSCTHRLSDKNSNSRTSKNRSSNYITSNTSNKSKLCTIQPIASNNNNDRARPSSHSVFIIIHQFIFFYRFRY